MSDWTSVPEMLRFVRLAVLKLTIGLISLALLGRDLGSAFGFAIGATLSLWLFGRLVNSAAKSLQMPKEAAQVYAASSYILRYLITASLIALVYVSPNINLYATIVGILLVKVVIVGQGLVQLVRDGGIAYLKHLAGRWRQKGGD